MGLKQMFMDFISPKPKPKKKKKKKAAPVSIGHGARAIRKHQKDLDDAFDAN